MKKVRAVICIVFLAGIISVITVKAGLLDKILGTSMVTSSQLEQAIYIDELSTAEFIYNGIAEKYKEDNEDEIECYVAYNSSVKVGIKMEDVKFKINKDKKKITPVLPALKINIATVDPDSISYIPKNPDIELKEVIKLCKEDAMREANDSKELYETAEENIKSVIEALLDPVVSSKGYSIIW